MTVFCRVILSADKISWLCRLCNIPFTNCTYFDCRLKQQQQRW